jgi:hypothetical protein
MLLNKLKSRFESPSFSFFDPSRQIRVLILEAGKPNSQISASFQSVILRPRKWPRREQRVEWEAASYCWGDQKPSCTIKLNGEEKQVTANVHKILCELRYRTEKRVLWIDYLCINQKDDKEKELQIPMMR